LDKRLVISAKSKTLNPKSPMPNACLPQRFMGAKPAEPAKGGRFPLLASLAPLREQPVLRSHHHLPNDKVRIAAFLIGVSPIIEESVIHSFSSSSAGRPFRSTSDSSAASAPMPTARTSAAPDSNGRLQQPDPVLVVPEDCFPVIAPTHHVVNGSGKLNSRLARHPRRTLCHASDDVMMLILQLSD